MTDDDGPYEDDAAAQWLRAQRPAPPAALRERGRQIVRRAVYERTLRRRAATLLSTGGVALMAAAAIVLIGA
jgi:hypothetical protein